MIYGFFTPRHTRVHPVRIVCRDRRARARFTVAAAAGATGLEEP